MKEWKKRWQRFLVLVLTVAMVGGSLEQSSFTVSAAEQGADLQAPAEGEETQKGESLCTCTELCTEDNVQEDCPVCGVENADLTACAGAGDDAARSEKPDGGTSEEEPQKPDDAVSQEGQPVTPDEGPKSEEPQKEEDAADAAVEEVQKLLEKLPDVETVKAQSQEEQSDSYAQVQAAYDAYEALTEEQQSQIDGAEEVFEELFGYFNGQINPLNEQEPLEDPIVWTESFENETSAPAISLFSLDDGKIELKDSNEVNWIDRIDIPEEIRAFYDKLVEGSDNDGQDDVLIEDNAGDANILVVEKTGPYAQGVDNLSQIAGEIYNQYRPFITAAYNAFDRDHPEIFWLSGTSAVGCSASTKVVQDAATGVRQQIYIVKISFILKGTVNEEAFDVRATGYQDADTIRAAIAERDTRVAALTSAVAGKDPVEQIKYFNAQLTKTNEYNTSSNLNNIAHECRECMSALKGSTGTTGPVCEGYARAFKVLCDKVGIPCVLVDGNARNSTTSSGEAHMWNYVQVDDTWYGVDVTWDDPVVSGKPGAVSGYENENWLLVGADTLISGMKFIDSHPVSNTVSLGGVSFINGPVLSSGKYEQVPIRSINITADPDHVVYGYESPITLMTEIVGETDGVTYQWYSVDGEKETLLANETSSAFIFQTGKGAGSYTYRVKATIGDYTKSADITITVTKAEGAVENKTEGGYAASYIYNAAAIPVPTADNFSTTAGAFSFTWYQDSVSEENRLSGAPKDAGSYILKVDAAETENVMAASCTVEVTIEKAPLTITAKAQTITYGDAIPSGTNAVAVEGLQGADQLTSIGLDVSGTDVTANGTITPKEAVIGQGNETNTANYEITYVAGKLVVNKSRPTLKFRAGYDLDKTYDGTAVSVSASEALTLVGASANDVTFAWYENSVAEGNKLSAAPKDAGSYILVAEIAETLNTAEASAQLEVVIAQRNITIEAKDQVIEYGKDIDTGVDQVEIVGSSLAAGDHLTGITLTPSNTDVDTEDKTITPGDAVIVNGENQDVSGNYKITYQPGALTVTKTTPSYTIPTGLQATYGQTLANVTIPSESNGTWAWENSNQPVGNVGTNQFTAVFTPNDPNYAAVSAEVAVEVFAAEPKMTFAQTAQEYIYTGKEAEIVAPTITLLGSDTFDGEISYSYMVAEDGITTEGLPSAAGSYTITAKIPASGNYTAAEATCTLTISYLTVPDEILYNGTAQQPVYGQPVEIRAAGYGVSTSLNGEFAPSYTISAPDEDGEREVTLYFQNEKGQITDGQKITVKL